MAGKDLLMRPDAGLSSLDFFVNFEPFCGDSKPVERPESRVEQEFAAKRCDPPACYATPAGQGSGG